MSLCCHATFKLFCGFTSSDENYGGSLCHQSVELQQRRILVVVLVDVNVELLDALDRQILVC